MSATPEVPKSDAVAQQLFAPGSVVLRRYTLTRFLGRGGMGVVWLARDNELQHDVALKFLPETLAADKIAVDDLKREVRRVIDLAHPHIVKIYDFVTDGMLAGISMEFINGRTLAERRLDESSRVFSISKLTPFAAQLCQALHYAHVDAKVVHRDLKPANIMITHDGRVKILDFGIAASMSESASRVSNKATSGTLVYMSPQQLLGKAPCAVDDIYAFGATLYEMLTSKPPFFRGDVTHQVLHDIPALVEERRRELGVECDEILPPPWSTTIAACLAKDPAARPTSFSEVARRLGIDAGIPLSTSWDQTRVAPNHGVTITSDAMPAPAANPSAKPPAATRRPPSARTKKWVLAGSAAAGLAGIFLGLGGIDRLHSLGRALSAEVASLRAGKTAPAKKANEEIARQAEERAQQQWISDLQQKLEPLSLSNRYDTLQKLTPGEVARLTAEHKSELAKIQQDVRDGLQEEVQTKLASAERAGAAGHLSDALTSIESLVPYQSLVPEIAPARAKVLAAQAHSDIDRTKELSSQGDYSGALALLDHAEKTGQASAEIAAARNRIFNEAEWPSVQKISQAIRRLATNEVQAAIDEYSKLTGRSVSVRAEALMTERDFNHFLAQLRELHILPVNTTVRTHALDLLVVTSRRRQFDQQDRVAGFLARNYSDWASQQLQAGKRGFALYLDDQAKAEGGNGDPMLRRDALSGFGSDLALELSISKPTLAPSTAPIIGTDPRDSIQQGFSEKLGSWFKISDNNESAVSPPHFVFRSGAKGPLQTNAPVKQSRTEYTEYQNGEIVENNPAWLAKKSELDAATADRNRILNTPPSKGVFGVLANGITVAGKSIIKGSQAKELAAANQKVEMLQNQLRDLPPTFHKPNILKEPYRVTTIVTSYRAELTGQLEYNGTSLGRPTTWTAITDFSTEEVVGNSNHNVPVRQAQPPDLSSIAHTLSDAIAAQARSTVGNWLPFLRDASFEIVRQRLRDSKASPEIVADRTWELAERWEHSGVQVPDLTQIETEVRTQLGLR